MHISLGYLAFVAAWSALYGLYRPAIEPWLAAVGRSEVVVGAVFLAASMGLALLALPYCRRHRRASVRHRAAIGRVQDHAHFILDDRGCVVDWTIDLTRDARSTDARVVELPFEEFFTETDRLVGTPRALLERAVNCGRAEAYGWRLRLDGSRHWSRTTIHAMFRPGGALRGYAFINLDLGESAPESVRVRPIPVEVLERAMAQVHCGCLQHDFADDSVHLSERASVAFGLEGHAPILPFSGWLACVLPEDRARLEALLHASESEHERHDVLFRVLQPDGDVRLVHATISVITGPFGIPQRSCWTLMQVTDAARTPATLRLRATDDRDPDGRGAEAIITLDEQLKVVQITPAAEAMFRIPQRDARGMPLDWFVPFGIPAAQDGYHRLGVVRGVRADGDEFSAMAALASAAVGDERLLSIKMREVIDA